MDIINSEWLIKTDRMANDYEAGNISITEFSDDQLQYLVYYNWGYSGVTTAKATDEAEEELEKRNYPFNTQLAEELDERIQPFL